MTWGEFCRFLHETKDTDAAKVTLLAVVVRSAGRPDRRIDVEELMVVLARSRETVMQSLNRLADGPNPWVHRGAEMSQTGRPMLAYFTAKVVDG